MRNPRTSIWTALCISMNKSFIHGILFSGFSFINRGIGFLLLLILANYLTPSEYGYLNLFNTVVMIVGYFMVMSAEGYVPIAYFGESKGSVNQVISCLLSLCLSVSSLFLLVVLLFGEELSKALSLPENCLYLVVIIGAFSALINLKLDLYRIREKVINYGILSCSNAILNFILSVLFIKYMLMGWQGRAYAYSFCCILFGCLCLWSIIRSYSLQKVDLRVLKMMLLYGLPLIPHLATNFIRQGCDRYIINYWHGVDEVGLFSFALNLVNIITMVGYGFNQSNSISLYKVLGGNTSDKEKWVTIKSFIRRYLSIYAAIAIIIVIVTYFVLGGLFPQYSSSMSYYLILSVYGLGVCEYLVYTNFLFFYKDTKKLMYVTFGSSVLHLILSLLFTRIDLHITALIYAFTQIIVVLFIRHLALLKLKEKLNTN